MTVKYYVPEHFTGHEAIAISFDGIKAGIWTFQLRGDYITDGRYHIWLPPQKTLPENTRFLQADPFTTLTIPSTARSVVTTAYYGNDNALVAASGKGPNVNTYVENPDIATWGRYISNEYRRQDYYCFWQFSSSCYNSRSLCAFIAMGDC